MTCERLDALINRAADCRGRRRGEEEEEEGVTRVGKDIRINGAW